MKKSAKPEMLSKVVLSPRAAKNVGRFVGASIAVCVFLLAHFGVNFSPTTWADYLQDAIVCVLILGGLGYSAPTVYDLLYYFTNNKVKSVSFVILTEGIMTFARPIVDSGIGWYAVYTVVGICFIIVAGINLHVFSEIAASKLTKKPTLRKA